MYVCNRLPLPLTIEWVPTCAGEDGTVVKARGEGQRPHFPYPTDRLCVCSHTSLDDCIEPHHLRSFIWAGKRDPQSHILEKEEYPTPYVR